MGTLINDYNELRVIHVELTGRAAITTEGGRHEPPPEKTTALLYYLAYQADWVYRNDLVFLFYPDTEERKARQNLRALLTKVRRLSYVEGLVIEPTRLRWDVSTDVGLFREALAENRLAQAYRQYRGKLLEGFWLADAPEFESWLELERDELHRLWRRASLAFTQELSGQDRFEHAAEVLERLHRADPFNEEVLRSYLVALVHAGRQPEALKVFEAFQALLQREMDGEAESETQNLVEKIRSGAALPEQTVKGETVARAERASKPRLPSPTTPFIGREVEIESVIKHLRDPACRLLTIVGPGGMGKTRLALEVADRLAVTFKDGARFVPFEDVSAPALMVSAVADALGITFFGQRNPSDQLLDYLAGKDMLLVMDNLEQLLDGISLVSEMLQAAPGLKVLATSRERLGLHAESIQDLAAMTLPDPDSADLENSDAVKLFLQAATRARADFTLSEDANAVGRVCRQVGGMPLAIEHAASWLRVLSVAEVAEELEQGIGILESTLRDLPARHHNMQTVLDASWKHLSSREQMSLRKLSVFQGGFTREAATEVAEVGLPLLLALCNKSFVRREASGRFSQHPLLWQYLRDKAADEPETFAQTQEKHAIYFAALMHAHEALHQSMEAKRGREEIERELTNIQAAWYWAADHRREDVLDNIADALDDYYQGPGDYKNAEAMFAYATGKLNTQSLVRGRILRTIGHLRFWQHRNEAAAEALEKSVTIFRQHQSKRDEALALFYLALSTFSFRPGRETEALWHRCARLFVEVGDRNHAAWALGNEALFFREPSERENQLRESIRLFREVEGYDGVTLSLHNLAICLAQSYGAYQEAFDLLSEAIEIERLRGFEFRLAWWLNFQGHVLVYQGRLDEAETRYLEAKRIGETLERGFGEWELEHALLGLGRVALLRGEHKEAAATLNGALESSHRYPDTTGLKTEILRALAELAMKEERFTDATALSTEALQALRGHIFEDAWSEAFCRFQLGEQALAKREVQEAGEQLRHALALAEEWSLLPATLHLFVGFAGLAKQHGKFEQAATLLAVAANHSAGMFETISEARRRLEAFPKDLVEVGLARAKDANPNEIATKLLLGSATTA